MGFDLLTECFDKSRLCICSCCEQLCKTEYNWNSVFTTTASLPSALVSILAGTVVSTATSVQVGCKLSPLPVVFLCEVLAVSDVLSTGSAASGPKTCMSGEADSQKRVYLQVGFTQQGICFGVGTKH